MPKAWSSIPAVLLGLTATIVALSIHLLNLDERAELRALDLRLRYGAVLPTSGEVVQVNIDDSGIEQLGRWPWPRQQLADVIDALKSCGARAVAMDIVLPDPQKPRFVSEAIALDSAVAEEGGSPLPVFDDLILADAIGRSPACVVPMYVRPDQLGGRQGGDLEERMETLLAGDPHLSLEDSLLKLGADAQARRREAMKFYLLARGRYELDRLSVEAGLKGHTGPKGKIVPPLAIFARRAGATGFVSFQPDVDGLARRTAVLVTDGHRGFMQFGLAIAMTELERTHGAYRLRTDDNALTAEFADGTTRRIPLDSEGRMIIRWPASEAGMSQIPAAILAELSAKRRQLAQLPARASQLRVKLLSLGTGMPGDLEPDYFRLVELLGQMDRVTGERLAKERQLLQAELFQPALDKSESQYAQLQEQENHLEGQIGQISKSLVDRLRQGASLAAFLPETTTTPSDPKAAQARQILARLDGLPDEAKALQAEVDELESQVRDRVRGRICIIGSTSTAAADFVPTPMDSRTPGVAVNSAILQTVLSGSIASASPPSGRFIRQAPTWVDVLAILAAGALVSILTARWPVLRSSAVMLALPAGILAVNFYVFQRWGLWITAVSPVAAVLGSFLVVTAYRQLTEERAKRQIKDLFSHAMSPSLVDRLLEDPKLAEVGGRKSDVTLMFSDLASFTPLSERLGPQQTVKLLNRYFDRVTQVVQAERGGYLNKFLGDGVFAFFGAPVFQADHPRRAVQAAIDCQRQVALLNDELRKEGLVQVQLAVRMGLSTGEAMVGNCGSSQRMDYTAIGDCVNLASRLEGANKFFGTRILMADSTSQRCGDGFVRRPMGEILVAGMQTPVKVWEVMVGEESAIADGPLADVNSSAGPTLIQEYSRAMSLLADGRLEEAIAVFAEVQKTWPEDRPTQIFHTLAQEALGRPAGQAWHFDCSRWGGGVQIVWPWTLG